MTLTNRETKEGIVRSRFAKTLQEVVF